MKNILMVIGNWAVLGRPGYAGKKRSIRRQELQDRFGEGNWLIAHLVNEKLLSQDAALIHFENSYQEFFKNNPEVLEWLIQSAKDIYDTDVSNIHSGLDYSIQETDSAHLHDIAIRRVLKKMDKSFQGEKLLQIRGEDSEGFILSTGEVPFYKPELIISPQLKGWWKKNSIESFWQSNKMLAVRFETIYGMTNQMVGVVLRNDLDMGKGKFCVQAAHAVVSLIAERGVKWDFNKNPVEVWTIYDEKSLVELYKNALKLDINASLIKDAGKTQLAPGSKTAVGIGPVNETLFDKLLSPYSVQSLESYERKYRHFSNLQLQD